MDIPIDFEKIRINNSGNNGWTFDLLEEDTIWKVCYEGANILEMSKIVSWASAGTALGIYRNGTFIPHDTDLDFEIKLNYQKDNTELLKNIEETFLYNGFSLNRKMWYDDKLMQLAFVKNKVIFDIYMMYDGVDDENLINFNEHGIYYIPKELVKNLAFCKSLYVPYPTSDYLEFRYGNDWATPKESKNDWSEDCKCLK